MVCFDCSNDSIVIHVLLMIYIVVVFDYIV